MELLATAGGASLILIVLWDAFETVVLPRRVSSRRFRLTRLFYRATWKPYAAVSRRRRPGNPRENFLSIFGPLSLIALLATWALTPLFNDRERWSAELLEAHISFPVLAFSPGERQG
jgi:hypothetical protein